MRVPSQLPPGPSPRRGALPEDTRAECGEESTSAAVETAEVGYVKRHCLAAADE